MSITEQPPELEAKTTPQDIEQPEARALEWRRQKIASMAKATEHRSFPAAGLELRTLDSGTIQLTGYASVYGVPYDMGWYTEVIVAGAGKRTLSENPDVQLLLNHDSLPLARTVSGTLNLSEDQRGLYVEADLDPEDLDVQALVRKNKRGDLDQMSFAFRCTDDSWNEELDQRTIRAYSLHRGDVSVVNYGANPATQFSARSDASTKALDGVISVLEARAGKTLSAATMETLTQVLKLVSNADDAVDEAQPLLADLMGVENPDDDEGSEDEPTTADDAARSAEAELESPEVTEPEPRAVIPDYRRREREQLARLRRTA